ncbi:MAG: IS30 family transposase [Candidatus Izemoplasmatales bacterium]|nr:IS30 family transposase [Candidatus Izemoplasmatales bacterium]
MSRLDYEDLLKVYKLISLDYSAYNISTIMNIHPSTLYRLIKNNLEIKKNNFNQNSHFRDCIYLPECRNLISKCPNQCDRYKKYLCYKLKSFPFVCDFCEAKTYCRKEHHYWNPDQVYRDRVDRLHNSRSHITLSKKQLSSFDCWLSPQIKQKKSIEVLHAMFPEMFPVSTSTVRRWINQSRLSARRIDLLRAVSFKVKKQYRYTRRKNANPLAKYGHTYNFFKDYMIIHPQASVMEFDTVHGIQSEKTKLLTIFHRSTHIQLGFLIPNLNPTSVNKVLSSLQSILSYSFQILFQVILADNGIEFDNLIDASIDNNSGELLSQVFYTRPYRSGDKGACERNHELFRYIVPKGHKLSDFNQKDINFIFSMINSYPRKSLNWKSPIDVFLNSFPKSLLDSLSIQAIPLDDINFNR